MILRKIFAVFVSPFLIILPFLSLSYLDVHAASSYNCVVSEETVFGGTKEIQLQTFQVPSDCLAYCTVDNTAKVLGRRPGTASCVAIGGSTPSPVSPGGGTPSPISPGPGTPSPISPSPGTPNPVSPGGSFKLTNPIKANSFADIMVRVARIVVLIGLPLVVIMFIYAGSLYVFAQGNEARITKAHQAFFWTVIGALLIVGAEAISLMIQNFARQL